MISDSEHVQTDDTGSEVRPLTAVLRRRRIVGAAGGLGVLLAVQARSALGQGVCESPSAMMSGNTSPREGEVSTCSGGFSPGFWKQPQHSGMWTSAGAIFPLFNVVLQECQTGQSDVTSSIIADPGTLVTSLFPAAPGDYVGIGLWEVIAFPNNFDDGQLIRHLICAWLNAGAVAGYPLTQQQVQEMYAQLASSGYYCPDGVVCAEGGMSAEDVASYIAGMYDINTSYESDMCTADQSASTGGTTGGTTGGGGKNKKR